MKCHKCQFDNREEGKFCKKCGIELGLLCPSCSHPYTPDNIFCDECGHELNGAVKTEKPVPIIDSERKHVTVLFTDLSGYTAMSERLDPEEVREITSRIFGEIAQVVAKYEGFIEKFVGDAVLAIFGAIRAYEDDPIRAIRAAREIHNLVESLSPRYEERVGQPLLMHSGISTGLVVTGEISLDKGTHGIIGDPINLASRLSRLGQAGNILVAPDTYCQTEGYFNYEDIGLIKVKGKTESLQVYRVLTPKAQPRKVRRIHGLRADLIGRKIEIDKLRNAVDILKNGKGSIFSICGDAGTGKSRLVEEFKATLNLKKIQWIEGHAYPYTQNIPYFPLIDLLNRAFKIQEYDTAEKVKEKVELGIELLIGEKEDLTPYVGSLFSVRYPELEEVSPELWKNRLHEAIQKILSALAQRAPTIICIEDLHWADPSSLDLLRFLLMEPECSALFLCVYRSPYSPFSDYNIGSIEMSHQDIHLLDLSPSDALDMVKSMLRDDSIPSALLKFINKKAEGNPFYLEEVINSLIESEILVRNNGVWRLTRSITEFDISPTIHGVISARVDRLGKETKRILQEASVIGRTFLYEILKSVTGAKGGIDGCLNDLEHLDIIRTRSIQPDLEYIFKHALSQEVIYSSVLKKDREAIHERIASVMEQMFHDRLSEFYETLAFHFAQARVDIKAVFYLMKSGRKSLRRYAVEESHQHFQQAFDLICGKLHKTMDEKEVLIDILINWALVFYYRGDFKGLEELMRSHMNIAETMADRAKIGIFYSWFGFALFCREKIKDSYIYLKKALELGEKIENQLVICSACTSLTWVCAELGLFKEGIQYGERAQGICETIDSDSTLFFQSLGGMSFNYFYMGESQKNFEIGKTLLNYGRKYSSSRSLVVGHISIGHAYWAAGKLSSAIECYQKAIEVAKDPFYLQWPGLFLGMSIAQSEQFRESEPPLQKVLEYGMNCGCESIGSPAYLFLGVVMIRKGSMALGLNMIKEKLESCKQNERKFGIVLIEYILGKFFFQLALRLEPVSLSNMFRNIAFLIRYLPVAEKKALVHFNSAIEAASEIGANGIMGQVYYDMGILHKLKKRTGQARECLSRAAQIFEQCEANIYQEQTREALKSL